MFFLTNHNITNTNLSYYNYSALSSTIIELLTADFLLEQASNELGFLISAGQVTATEVFDSPFIDITVQLRD